MANRYDVNFVFTETIQLIQPAVEYVVRKLLRIIIKFIDRTQHGLCLYDRNKDVLNYI